MLKSNRSKSSYRLSQKGVDLLNKLGFEFHTDKHPVGEGNLLTRRLQSSEIALALLHTGVNVFLTDFPSRNRNPCYLSSYAFRRNSCANVLGMAKFNGFYLLPDEAYVIYHLESKLSGFYPRTEADTFQRLLMGADRKAKVLYIGGKDFDEMYTLFNRKKESDKKNYCDFKSAVEEFYCDASILPLNSIGMRILRIISTPDYREKLASCLLLEGNVEITPISDGLIEEGLYLQINFDTNFKRLQKALNYFGKIGLMTTNEQSLSLPKEFDSDNINRYVINLEQIEKFIEIGSPPDLSSIPYVNESGNGAYVGEETLCV